MTTTSNAPDVVSPIRGPGDGDDVAFVIAERAGHAPGELLAPTTDTVTSNLYGHFTYADHTERSVDQGF